MIIEKELFRLNESIVTKRGLRKHQHVSEDIDDLVEDTVKQGNKWVNKGDEGTHGEFTTKKEADAQRKAMFANGYKESTTDENMIEDITLSNKAADGNEMIFKVKDDGTFTIYQDGKEQMTNKVVNAKDFIDQLKAANFKVEEETVEQALEENIDSTELIEDTFSTSASPDCDNAVADIVAMEIDEITQLKAQQEADLVIMLNDLITDENEAINGYESAIVTLELHNKGELTNAIREILNDEQKHIGSLQTILDQIKPDTQELIDAGNQETAEVLNKESAPADDPEEGMHY